MSDSSDLFMGYTMGQNDGNNRNDNDLEDLILLALLFGGFGNNGGGIFGNGGGGCQSAVSSGFALNGIENGIRGIQQGLCDGFYAVNTSLLTGFNGIQSLLASCCCETQRGIDGIGRNIDSVRYDMAKGFCDMGTVFTTGVRDIIDNANNNYRSMMDFMVQEKLSSKDAEIAALRNQVSQANQNAVIGAQIDAAVATILRRTGAECPTAAYLVNAPTPVNFPVNSCGQVQFGGYGNGCGCGNCGC
jgi:hypothetical protein